MLFQEYFILYFQNSFKVFCPSLFSLNSEQGVDVEAEAEAETGFCMLLLLLHASTPLLRCESQL
jgi:hypothetical protein